MDTRAAALGAAEGAAGRGGAAFPCSGAAGFGVEAGALVVARGAVGRGAGRRVDAAEGTGAGGAARVGTDAGAVGCGWTGGV